MIEIKNLIKKYRNGTSDQVVLDKIELSFKPGEFIAIYGPSGSGKSTLLNLLGILDRPNSGTLLLDGNVINSPRKQTDKAISNYRRKKIGFIFQQFNLIPHITVLENVKMPMILDGVKDSIAKERAIELLDKFGVKSEMNKLPSLLSGGQQQRVTIARALANDPDVILADEPTGSLDPETSKLVLEILKSISESGKLVVIVTHDDSVLDYTTRTIDIFNGKTKDTFEKREKLDFEYKQMYSSFMNGLRFALSNIKNRLKRFMIIALIASVSITSVLMAMQVNKGVDDYINYQGGDFNNPRIVYIYKMSSNANGRTPVEQPFGRLDVLLPVQVDDRVVAGFIREEYASNAEYGDYNGDVRIYSIFPTTDGIEDVQDVEIAYGRKPKEDSEEVALTDSFARSLLVNSELTEIEDLVNTYITIVNKRGSDITKYEFLISGIFKENALTRNDGSQVNRNIFMPLSTQIKLKQQHPIGMKNVGNKALFLAADKDAAQDLIYEYKEAAKNLEQIRYYDLSPLSKFMGSISMLNTIIFAIVIVSLVLAVVMVAVLLHLNVVERRKEIGIIKSIGSRKSDIKSIFYAEAFLLGIGIWVSSILTVSVLNILINFYLKAAYETQIIKLSIGFRNAIILLAVSIVTSFVASIYPVNRAVAIDPIKVLNE